MSTTKLVANHPYSLIGLLKLLVITLFINLPCHQWRIHSMESNPAMASLWIQGWGGQPRHASLRTIISKPINRPVLLYQTSRGILFWDTVSISRIRGQYESSDMHRWVAATRL